MISVDTGASGEICGNVFVHDIATVNNDAKCVGFNELDVRFQEPTTSGKYDAGITNHGSIITRR